MGDISPEKKTAGCGLFSVVFGRRSFWPRRSTSTGSIHTVNAANFTRTPSTPKRRKSGSDEAAFLDNSHSVAEGQKKSITKAPMHPKIPHAQNQNYCKKLPEEATKTSSDQGYSNQNQGYSNQNAYVNQGRRVPKEAVGISGELESMISDHQKSKGSSTLVRASSSNVMLHGNLGNLRQGGGGGNTAYSVLDYLPKTAREEALTADGKYPNSVMGNVVKKQREEKPNVGAQPPAAISIDPNKASYRSNRSAALTALGKILEAVFECREAIRIEPHYHRAHHRLANLYLRLGEAEKAIYHYKHAGPEADHFDISKAKSLQAHLNKCTDAHKHRDWNTLIKETAATISAGADSAPQIFALQAEALIKLHRHQEAGEASIRCPNFDVDACTKFFGPIGNANLLVVRAQVHMALGRFDDALAAVQRATRLDSNNKEANLVLRKAKAVAAARSNGNQLFKAAKFYEASSAYSEGLEHDPYNSVLLCNRAACRSKLGQYEKAVEDCNAALTVRPGYSKARLRRADCHSKLEKWEVSIKDYEMLQK
ncbi:TPR REPEAT-CONTAINING THIOREDOXIN [Salix koriyanagi]|uniref:TPR REPEAT-CONTAINING THIOREDOXIN n=1 Tax=Salix koriyanagi TaxID=2511006 RepID=A0A9Q0SMA1_9ROSI|nr:TPR REPEAT-CONTAINING THIOREDOXIN [Salix koriyanagi]